jgi:hypothetical protein
MGERRADHDRGELGRFENLGGLNQGKDESSGYGKKTGHQGEVSGIEASHEISPEKMG